MSSSRSRVRICAHRGWSTRFPENSLAAFAAAYVAGADELEFDVRHTADGVPVIVHDATMARTSDSDAAVADLTLEEFRRLSLRSPHDGRVIAGHPPPTLAQILDLFGGRIGMNIHVSDANPPPAAFVMLARLPWAPDNPNVYFAGGEAVMERALNHAPNVQRACLVKQNEPELMLEAAREYRCQRVQFFKGNVTAELLARAREGGFVSNLFYSDEPGEVAGLAAMGVDVVLTNDVGALVAVC